MVTDPLLSTLLLLLIVARTVSSWPASSESSDQLQQLSRQVDELAADRLKDKEQLKQLGSLVAELKSVGGQMKQFADHLVSQRRVMDASWLGVRSEIDTLGREVALVRQLADRGSEEQEKTSTQATMVQWLQDMVTLLREQVTELSESFNLAEWQQMKTKLASQIQVLEAETTKQRDTMASVHLRLTASSEQANKLYSDLVTCKGVGEKALRLSKTSQQEMLELRKEFADLRSQYPAHRRHRRHRSRGGRRRPRASSHRSGAGGSSRNFHITALDNIIDVLYRKQESFGERMDLVENDVAALNSNHNTLQARQRGHSDDIDDIRREQRLISFKLNTSSSSETLRKLQASSVQLIREMDAVESKFDRQLVDVKSEIARIDVAWGQMNSSMENVGEEIRKMPEIAKQLREEISELSGSSDQCHAAMLSLQSEMLTRKLQCCVSTIGGADGLH